MKNNTPKNQCFILKCNNGPKQALIKLIGFISLPKTIQFDPVPMYREILNHNYRSEFDERSKPNNSRGKTAEKKKLIAPLLIKLIWSWWIIHPMLIF